MNHNKKKEGRELLGRELCWKEEGKRSGGKKQGRGETKTIVHPSATLQLFLFPFSVLGVARAGAEELKSLTLPMLATGLFLFELFRSFWAIGSRWMLY